MTEINPYRSTIDPFYRKGGFFKYSHGDVDANYKVQQLRLLLQHNRNKIHNSLVRIADIGCGTGKTTFLLHKMFSEANEMPIIVDGYDIHPFVSQLEGSTGVSFYSGDFCTIPHADIYDLAIMFDVIEHIPDPITFIREVSKSSRVLAFHIPLDDSLFSWIRNLQRDKLSQPGHLIVLDASAAINLLTFAGLRIIDFAYSPVFRAPSGQENLIQRFSNPVRDIMYRISPFLTQRIFAGVSLTVLAWTPYELASQ